GEDRQHIYQGLDVVDHGGLSEEPYLDRERWLAARLTPVPLDGVEDRGLLATDVSAGPAPDLDVERPALPEDVLAELAALATLLESVAQQPQGTRVLSA